MLGQVRMRGRARRGAQRRAWGVHRRRKDPRRLAFRQEAGEGKRGTMQPRPRAVTVGPLRPRVRDGREDIILMKLTGATRGS